MIQKTKLDKLKEKRTEIKDGYIKAKERRIEIVNSINELDNQIQEIDEIIEKSKENLKERHFNKLKFKNIFKTYPIRALLQWLTANFITAILNIFILGEFGVAPIGMITSGIVIVILNVVEYKITNKNSKNKKKKRKVMFKDLEKLENEKNILIKKRISKGAEYKRAREEELLREKIYKQLDPILATEMMCILEDEGIQQTNKSINTKDIYHKIKLDCSFDTEKIENKKIILDNELKKYVSSKISEIYHYVIDQKDLDFLTTEELVKMLVDNIPIERQNDILSNIIHAILNFSTNLQGYGVVWYEEKDISLINNPTVTFDEEGKWTEYKTHKKTNYYNTFKIAYNTFVNDVMNHSEIKNRTKSNR